MNNVYKSGSRPRDYPDYDEEAAEVLRMKNEYDRMAHELIEQIDVLLARIDYILIRDRELYQIGCGRDLSIDDREFLMHGNPKIEA